VRVRETCFAGLRGKTSDWGADAGKNPWGLPYLGTPPHPISTHYEVFLFSRFVWPPRAKEFGNVVVPCRIAHRGRWPGSKPIRCPWKRRSRKERGACWGPDNHNTFHRPKAPGRRALATCPLWRQGRDLFALPIARRPRKAENKRKGNGFFPDSPAMSRRHRRRGVVAGCREFRNR